ncbi:uncharacterized protein [Hyperolius riggenbachi]|uniref:uncharacterized protein n=1 Tax=Hyperolius riggenbachi TaxID=752182 RepID=UPI0035A29B0B
MQISERSTRSRRIPPEQIPLSDPESQSSPSDTAQYMCIECGETFDTRLELNSHRQCHVTKKQFTCMHCGRGFHHQVFLQMHEQSHEDGVSKAPAKTTAARVISTRSSKTSAGVNVKPTYTKPQRPLNSAVEFKKDPKVCQAFTPKECITRRTHGASSPTFQKSDGQEKDHFELRISKFSDTTVQLIDAFGNSIEIMTDVFNTYTISDPECSEEDNLNVAGDEALAETSVSSPSRNSQTDTVEDMQLSNEISLEPDSKNAVEEDAEERQTESSETSELKSNTDSSLPLCDVEMNENLTPETISPEDVVLPLPAPSILANASALEEDPTSQPSAEIPKTPIEETLQPAGVSQKDLPEDNRETFSPSPPSDICVTAEHQMDTSPENNEMLSASPASLPELQIEPSDIPEVDMNAANISSVTLVANQSATDVNFQEMSIQDNSSTSTVRAEPNQNEDDQSTIEISLQDNSSTSTVPAEPNQNEDDQSTIEKSLQDNSSTSTVPAEPNQNEDDQSTIEISLQDNSSTSTVPAEPNQNEDDQSTIDDTDLLKDSALSMTKSNVSEDNPSDEVVKEVVVDVERKETLTVQETDVQCEEQRVTPPPKSLHKPDEQQIENICEPAALSVSQPESNADELPTKEDAKLDLGNKSEETTTTKGTGDENIEAKSTSPTENEPSESSNADMAVPSEYELPPASNKDINMESEAALCIAPQEVAEVSISEGDSDMQEGSKNPEKAASPLPVQDMLYNDLCEKRHVDLFERDIFQSETPMEVCEKGQSPHDSRGPHSTLMVEDKVGDICVDDDNNMTYISESEMIKLLDQDRDDIVDNEPPITTNLESGQPSQMEDSETSPKPFTEPQIGNIAIETESFPTPVKQNVDEGTLTSHQPEASTSLQENTMQGQNDLRKTPVLEDTQKGVAVTNAWSPVSLPTNEKPGLADVEPEDPTADLLPQDSITESTSQEPVITEPSCSGDETVKNDLLPERSPLTENQHVEPHENISKALDVPSVGESIQSSAVHSNETYDVSVTVEDDGKEQTDTLELPEAGIEKQRASSPSHGLNPLIISDIVQKQNEIPESASDQLPAAPEEEIQKCISNQETDTPPQNARIEHEVTDKSSEVLDESARDVQNNHAIPSGNAEIKVESADKQVEHASSMEMEISRENTTETDVLVDKQTTDLSSDQDLLSCTIESSDLRKEIKEMGLEESVTLTELQNAELSEIPLAGFDPEDLANKTITDNVEEDLEEPSDIVTGVILDKDTAGSRKILDVITLSSGQPEGHDNPDVFLEDSELMEDEDEEDAENIGTAKPLGSAAECSKCGRRLRRSRKEMTWQTMCFKCRKAERKRHVNQDVNEHSKFGQELQQSRKERLSGEFSNSKIKQEQDSLQTAISKDPTTYADGSVSAGVKKEGLGLASKKMYKCPKCDKSFKIPALLAGHIRSHTLPQCLTCGCHMHLKYKTKRIPRRCKKCAKQLKEQRKEELNAEQSEDEDSETTDIDEFSRGKKPEVDMSDDEDSSVIVQKSKRTNPDHPANLAGKSLDDTDSLKNERENREEHESSDELEISDQSVVLPDGESPRLCHQCGKSFKCNRSLHLHLLSHSAVQCESCGCRLHKRRRVGRWSKKCRACRLQSKSQLFDDSGEQLLLPSDRALKQKHLAALRLKAKQLHIMKNRKIRSMIKQKKELKLMNMMLAVKGLMNKARKKKEIASKSVELIKDVENSEAGISDTSSVDESIGIGEDYPKTNLSFLSKEEPGSSGLQSFPKKALSSTPKRGRKCLYTEKNIIKVEENDNVPCGQGEVSSFAAAFIKQEETWECLECTISMPNLETLLSHQQGHIGGQSFTCTQCPQVFSSEQYLNIHTHAHDENRPFRCPDCDKTFTKRNHLGVHMRVHSGVRPFACLECPCRFRQKASLIAHRYSHRNYQLLFAKPYQCSMCTKSFKQRERLVVHERLHTGECPFSCKDCDKVFPSKARLNVHRKMHRILPSDPSSTNEQNVTGKDVLEGSPFRCQDCGKVCSTKASFVLHRKIHRLSEKILHPNLEEHPFNCRECKKVFSSKATLKMHLKNHSAHKPAASPGVVADFQKCFLCKDCGKVCSTKASFVLHRKVHKSLSSTEQQVLDIKVEPESHVYVCKDCGKVCSTKASFVLHYKVHKSTTGTEPNINIKTEPETQVFICKDCDKVCLTKASLVLHSKVHKSPFDEQNLKVKTEPGTQTFICKDCGKVCSTKASLVLHSRVHKSPFSDEQNLSIKAEPDSLAFICKYCDKVCSTKASLVLHCKVHKTPGAEGAFKTDTEKKSFVCKFCKAVFYSKTSFFLHRKMHRFPAGQPSSKGNAEQRQFNCKHCDMVCSTKASFVLHSKIHKLSSVDEQTSKDAEPQSYSCKDCDMVCSTKASFVLHSKVHKSPLDSEQNVKTDVQSISFTCKECGKVCSTKASFVLHCRMHKSPSSEHNLTPKGGQEEAQCKICGKVCSSKGRLSLHSKVHEPPLTSNQSSGGEMDTEQPKKTSEEKTFTCATCGLKFPKRKLLLLHKVVHGERTVMPCVHCGKRFLYKKSLFNHVNICQGQNKGKLLLLKKAAAKRKLVTEEGAEGTEEDNAQKKKKTDENKATKLKNKNLIKAKKVALKKEGGKVKGVSDAKTKTPKVKRPKGDGETNAEGEDKKTVTEKQGEVKQEKPAETTAKQQIGKEKKTTMKVKKPKKDLSKQKQEKVGSGGSKKWRVLATTVKKKKLQAVIIGGKKKLLLKKKGVQVKPKAGGKGSKD